MDGFVILVEFRVKPGMVGRFVEVVTPNAKASVRDEPGCRRFDILLPQEQADCVWLYEIYDDEDAFAAHLATPHYAQFKAASEPIVERQTVIRCGLTEHAKT
jgi:(4S)-4-hydroxy-5-phosphonooxypentane-2,3-dione isomerase